MFKSHKNQSSKSNTKPGKSTEKNNQPVLRQKTLSSFFFQSKKHPPATTETHGVDSVRKSGNKRPVAVDKVAIPRPSLLFDSQGSFDDCDPDEEIKRLIKAPRLNNFKSAVTPRLPSLHRSVSSVTQYQTDSDSPQKLTTVTSDTRQLSFTNRPDLGSETNEYGVARPSKRSASPHGFQGLRLKLPKRIKPITRKTSSLGKKTEPLNLTKEQETVLELVVRKNLNVFYTGCAGTGKSVILKSLIERLSSLYGKDAIGITASTGLAAATIGGTTLHKWSGIGIGNGTAEQLVKRIQKQYGLLAVWKNTKVLIVDEISMIDGKLLDKLEHIARRLRKNEKPFGGIQLVLTGDFFQLPPVQKRGENQQDTITVFCFESQMWKRCVQRTILLTKIFRQQDDELITMLNAIRFGAVTPDLVKTVKELGRAVEYTDGIAPTELYATRREVEASNARQLASLPGKAHQFHSIDTAPKEYLTLLDSSVMVDKVVTLKVDAQVMMLKNKPESELFNGSLGKVLFFTTERLERTMKDFYKVIDDDVVLDMRIVSQAIANPSIWDSREFQQDFHSRPLSRASNLQTLVSNAIKLSSKEPVYPYIRWSLNNDRFYHELMLPERFPVDLPGDKTGIERTQLPIMLCWALSIHKAQGQTIQRLKVDLRNIFEAGQVYVALSRAVSRDKLQVLNFNPKRIRANQKVKEFYQHLEVIS